MHYAQVEYPIAGPVRGEFTEVVPGVWWLRLPLPYRLDHINVWALQDGDGWALVDTGVRTEETVQVWERLTASAPFNGPLSRVLVTHMHPDHVGMAGWLTRKYGAKLSMSRQEYLACRVLVSDTGREAPGDALKFYEAAAWPPMAIEGYKARFGDFGKHIYALPDSYHRLQDGHKVQIGGHSWEVVMGNGHSPEHACLYCAELKLLISGDQVLPKISSNVSVQPIEPDANPMADWYASLDKVQARVPDDVLVLPAHNDCFHGLHARIEHLRKSQDEAMERLRAMLAQPQRVIDVFVALFRSPIEPSQAGQLGLATGEAVACLNYLLQRGEAVKEMRGPIAWYRRA